MVRPLSDPVLAAIDVGTNAVRLELARLLPDGSLETLHQERDPVRPGEGVFTQGVIARPVADRLMSTLRRYAALARRYHAQVRAVATSAVREARNRDDIVRRARVEAGLRLEVVSGLEEARLICLGVLHGKGPGVRSLCIDIGGGSTEVATAIGERPTQLWSVALGAVRLTELFDSAGRVSGKQLQLMRRYAQDAVRDALPPRSAGPTRKALGSSGTIQAVVGFASDGAGFATTRQVSRAVEALADLSPGERRERFDPRRAEIIVAGAVILEALLSQLRLASVTAVQRGLRDGILVDFVLRRSVRPADASLAEAAARIGERFHYDAAHSTQVTRLALALFDELAPLHGLPASTRPLLEVAAVLHDVGNAVSHQRHHKHTHYLIQNADIPGLGERDRALVALVARFHRRSPPDSGHPDLASLPGPDVRLVQKLSTLLRVADSLDRGHRAAVLGIRAVLGRRSVRLRLSAHAPLDLELWDVAHEVPHFRKVFRRALAFDTVRIRRGGQERDGRRVRP